MEAALVQASIFQKTYKDYLEQISQLDLQARKPVLGYEMDGPRAAIAMFDQLFYVGQGDICDEEGHRPDLAVAVVLCKYLLLCPSTLLDTQALQTFKDFEDAAPLISYFDNTVQGWIARHYSGRSEALGRACRGIGGVPHTQDLAYEIKYRLMGLPRIPLYLLFNDAEEGFAAQCTLLFEHRAKDYLDMESLAMLASTMSVRLKKAENRHQVDSA